MYYVTVSKFGNRKKRITIWLNVMIKLLKAMISLNKYKRCAFQSQNMAWVFLYYVAMKGTGCL